jgi:hypothetical protein
MTTEVTEPILRELCVRTARELSYLARTDQPVLVRPASSLVFPTYRVGSARGKVRISEQEARAVFLQRAAASEHELYCSLETPTALKYDFTGVTPTTVPDHQLGGQSALTDASLFVLHDGELCQDVNVEFKAHNVEPGPILKDLLKLVQEEPKGLFFHVLQGVDAGTLRNASKTGVLDKYTKALFEVRGNARPAGWFVLFAICILGPRRLVALKTLDEADYAGFRSLADVDHFFSTLQVTRRAGRQAAPRRAASLQNGWSIVAL